MQPFTIETTYKSVVILPSQTCLEPPANTYLLRMNGKSVPGANPSLPASDGVGEVRAYPSPDTRQAPKAEPNKDSFTCLVPIYLGGVG